MTPLKEQICAHCERPMEPTAWRFCVAADAMERHWTCENCQIYSKEMSNWSDLMAFHRFNPPKMPAGMSIMPSEAIISRSEFDRLKGIDNKLNTDWLLVRKSDYADALSRQAEPPMQLSRMEADIGKLRAYLGSNLFDEIVSGKVKADPLTPSPWRNPVGNWRGPVR